MPTSQPVKAPLGAVPPNVCAPFPVRRAGRRPVLRGSSPWLLPPVCCSLYRDGENAPSAAPSSPKEENHEDANIRCGWNDFDRRPGPSHPPLAELYARRCAGLVRGCPPSVAMGEPPGTYDGPAPERRGPGGDDEV